ncbi:MAG: MBOAT family protein [Pseudomonadota bacterium]
MLFSSTVFVFAFLPISLSVFFWTFRLFGRSAALTWISLCSLFFYGYWRLDYLPLLLGSVAFNFAVSRRIQTLVRSSESRGRQAYAWTFFGVAANLGLLGYFKYFGFFLQTINDLSGSDYRTLSLVLPLAISFFTFQQITYLIDSYRGQAKRAGALNYMVFVTFFPQLIAGPIVHHKEMMPQFLKPSFGTFRARYLLLGLITFSLGLFKKLIIADSLAVHADQGCSDVAQLTLLDAWLASLSYTFQLYFDFSGYSDMAIGIALMFGIRLPLNFLSPYKSISIQQFWRRWHMTLSRFLRDYIYISLGGGRRAPARVAGNLMVTFLLGGLWHGAGWTFLIWGAIHGAALVIGRFMSPITRFVPRAVKWGVTFLIVHIGWVFFRAESVGDAVTVLSAMFGLREMSADSPSHIVLTQSDLAAFWVVIAFSIALALPNTHQVTRDIRPFWKTGLAAICFGTACLAMLANKSQVFLYFNF